MNAFKIPTPTECPQPGSAGAACCSAAPRSAAPPCSAAASAAAIAPSTSGASTTLHHRSPCSPRCPTPSPRRRWKPSSRTSPVRRPAQHGGHRAVPGPATDLPVLGQPAGRADLVRRIGGPRLRQQGPAAGRVGPVDRRRRLRQVLPRAEEPVQRRRRQADLRPDQLLLVERLLPEVGVRGVGRQAGRRPGTSSWRCATRSRARASTPLTIGTGVHALDGLGLVRLPRPADQRRAVPPGPAGRQALLRQRRGDAR